MFCVFYNLPFITVRVKRFPLEEEIRIPQELMNLWDEVQNQGSMSKTSGVFADPQWNDQWYLHEKLSRDSRSDRSLHVIPNFNHGYTGQGIKIVVLDDGLEHTHPVIKGNYEPSISMISMTMIRIRLHEYLRVPMRTQIPMRPDVLGKLP